MNVYRLTVLLFVAVVVALFAETLSAQQRQQDVVATVDGEAVTRLEVERVLREALRGREITDEARPYAEAAALDQAINRRLILGWLQSQEIAATDTEIQTAYEEFLKNLEFQQTQLTDYLEREKLTEDALRRSIIWDISWGRHRRQQLTIEARKEFFAKHRRKFDGTQMRVRHILLGDPSTDVDARRAQAEEIRSRLVSGTISFAEAVSQYSAGSKENSGDIGLIERNSSMPDAFAAAVFELELGDISPPVVTPFGVHLIEVTEIKPGKKELKDVVQKVDQAMTREMLEQLVDKLRAEAQLSFKRNMPYFDPETGELKTPAR
ncbi:MAG: peptidylprolyl isomerase [Pirellulales bacterium]|nr:peptidylprolyl isomerase [Pirellulales bacterium]